MIFCVRGSHVIFGMLVVPRPLCHVLSLEPAFPSNSGLRASTAAARTQNNHDIEKNEKYEHTKC